LVSPETREDDNPENDDLGEKKNVMRLQKWYKEQRMTADLILWKVMLFPSLTLHL
jgi:hypothetical protein